MIIIYNILIFLIFQMYGQTNGIKVNRNGIEFPNGTQQVSAAQQNNNNGGAPESTQHHNRFVFTKNIDSASTDLLNKWNSE